MSFRAQNSRLACVAALAAGVLAFGLGACGDDDAGAGNPTSELTLAEATAPLRNASPELAAIRRQANEILEGGLDAFRARLEELSGTPVVINKWASWCGPCRLEFPMFQSQALEHEHEVAFLGLLSSDGAATGASFLEQLPLPYPSYLDPDLEIAEDLNAGREFPSTVFVDSGGEVTFTKLGPYDDEAMLAADIERYAR